MLQYTRLARHFDVDELPPILLDHLPSGPLSFADFGCGDGPLLAALERRGTIGPERPVYAVDLSAERLHRVTSRFPFILAEVASAEDVPAIASGCLDFVSSTMVMEHVPDERRYLGEIARVLRPKGRAYLTTVFKRRWAWYFRRRNGEPVLDVTHLREYVDLDAFQRLLMDDGHFSALRALELQQIWFPMVDPFLFRWISAGGPVPPDQWLRRVRRLKVPIPGYYALHVVLER